MTFANATKWTGCVFGTVLLSVTASGRYRPPVPADFVRLDADEIQVGNVYGDPNKPGCTSSVTGLCRAKAAGRTITIRIAT